MGGVVVKTATPNFCKKNFVGSHPPLCARLGSLPPVPLMSLRVILFSWGCYCSGESAINSNVLSLYFHPSRVGNKKAPTMFRKCLICNDLFVTPTGFKPVTA